MQGSIQNFLNKYGLRRYLSKYLVSRSKIKCDINQHYLKTILSNLNNFHSLEVVDRVSETQLYVGENSD